MKMEDYIAMMLIRREEGHALFIWTKLKVILSIQFGVIFLLSILLQKNAKIIQLKNLKRSLSA